MEAYWKDDFRPLQAAGKAVLAALRADEEAPDADLYRRIISTSTIVSTSSSTSSTSSPSAAPPLFETNITKGSHLYYLADNYAGSSSNIGNNTSNAGAAPTTAAAAAAAAPSFTFPPSPFATTAAATTPQQQQAQTQQRVTTTVKQSVPAIRLSHQQSIPMLDALKRQLSTHLQTCLFLGIFAPVQLAYMTIDDKLYLFPLHQTANISSSNTTSASSGANATFTCFTNSRKQPILAVALVRPKPGKKKTKSQTNKQTKSHTRKPFIFTSSSKT
jgi:Nup133 N terminal like